MLYASKEVSVITRLDRISCSKSSPDLNYPFFITFYCDATTSRSQTFQGIVTNAGRVATSDKVSVEALQGSDVTVSPQILRFQKVNEKQSYTMNINHKGRERDEVSCGGVGVESSRNMLELKYYTSHDVSCYNDTILVLVSFLFNLDHRTVFFFFF